MNVSGIFIPRSFLQVKRPKNFKDFRDNLVFEELNKFEIDEDSKLDDKKETLGFAES